VLKNIKDKDTPEDGHGSFGLVAALNRELETALGSEGISKEFKERHNEGQFEVEVADPTQSQISWQ